MVRLKGNRNLLCFRRFFIFQFLMVRLKVVHKFWNASGHHKISIPYGAIKSHISKNSIIYIVDISIPYGAIKS